MDERVLIITGASSGIGQATARVAAAAGMRLVLLARREERLAALAEELDPNRVLPLRADVRSFEDQQRAVELALNKFGRIDAVFANAGIGGQPGGFRRADPDYWRELILTNVYGVALTLRASLAALEVSKGHVVLNGSVAGRRPLAGSMYSVTKWAVSAIGYNLREELRGTGIRVTLLEPGTVDTPFFDNPRPEGLRPEDIANSVLYALQQPPTVDVHELLIMPTPPVD